MGLQRFPRLLLNENISMELNLAEHTITPQLWLTLITFLLKTCQEHKCSTKNPDVIGFKENKKTNNKLLTAMCCCLHKYIHVYVSVT